MPHTASDSNSDFNYFALGAANTNSTSIVSTPCWLKGFHLTNINAAVVYLKIYDKAIAPTVGTDIPVMVIPVPGATTGGITSLYIEAGFYLVNGLGIGLVTGIANSDATAPSANQQVINILYRKS